MPRTKIVHGYCKLKDKDVNLLKEAISEMGRNGVMSWSVRKCLYKDKACEEAGCMYAPRGIGNVGNVDPFA